MRIAPITIKTLLIAKGGEPASASLAPRLRQGQTVAVDGGVTGI